MAQKRMFDKYVIDSDEFLDMPLTSQALYFHLSMRADDDGFIDNWKSIMRIIGAKDDDIKVLIAKSFIIPFESGIIVIKHWRINNYLQKDRKKNTRHITELQSLKEINGEYYLLENNEISNILLIDSENKEIPDWQVKRDEAYRNSSLPYSFLYKIRNAFVGEKCPVCNSIMSASAQKKYMPSIQHLLPISKGGKHEIDNIAIVCLSCNTSLRDKICDNKLNNDLVIKKWQSILNNDTNCLSRLTSGSIDKNRIDKNSILIYEQNHSNVEQEFEQLWSKYPNKKGKKDALKHYKSARKKGIAFEKIDKGLNNYIEYLNKNPDKLKYAKYGSTWFNGECWDDVYNDNDIQETNYEKNKRLIEEYFGKDDELE